MCSAAINDESADRVLRKEERKRERERRGRGEEEGGTAVDVGGKGRGEEYFLNERRIFDMSMVRC